MKRKFVVNILILVLLANLSSGLLTAIVANAAGETLPFSDDFETGYDGLAESADASDKLWSKWNLVMPQTAKGGALRIHTVKDKNNNDTKVLFIGSDNGNGGADAYVGVGSNADLTGNIEIAFKFKFATSTINQFKVVFRDANNFIDSLYIDNNETNNVKLFGETVNGFKLSTTAWSDIKLVVNTTDKKVSLDVNGTPIVTEQTFTVPANANFAQCAIRLSTWNWATAGLCGYYVDDISMQKLEGNIDPPEETEWEVDSNVFTDNFENGYTAAVGVDASIQVNAKWPYVDPKSSAGGLFEIHNVGDSNKSLLIGTKEETSWADPYIQVGEMNEGFPIGDCTQVSFKIREYGGWQNAFVVSTRHSGGDIKNILALNRTNFVFFDKTTNTGMINGTEWTDVSIFLNTAEGKAKVTINNTTVEADIPSDFKTDAMELRFSGNFWTMQADPANRTVIGYYIDSVSIDKMKVKTEPSTPPPTPPITPPPTPPVTPTEYIEKMIEDNNFNAMQKGTLPLSFGASNAWASGAKDITKLEAQEIDTTHGTSLVLTALTTNSNWGGGYVQYNIPKAKNSGRFSFEGDFYFDSPTGKDIALFNLRSDSAQWSKTAVMSGDSSASISYAYKEGSDEKFQSVFAITDKTWYTIKAEYDLFEKKYNLYVDGTKVVTDQPMINQLVSPDDGYAIRFTMDSKLSVGAMAIDNVKVVMYYEPPSVQSMTFTKVDNSIYTLSYEVPTTIKNINIRFNQSMDAASMSNQNIKLFIGDEHDGLEIPSSGVYTSATNTYCLTSSVIPLSGATDYTVIIGKNVISSLSQVESGTNRYHRFTTVDTEGLYAVDKMFLTGTTEVLDMTDLTGKKVKYTLNAVNKTNDKCTVTVILALYKAGILYEIKSKTVELAKDAELDVETPEITTPEGDGYYYKGFANNGYAEMHPIGLSRTIK